MLFPLTVEEHINCCGIRHIVDFWDDESFMDIIYGEGRKAKATDKVESIEDAIERCKNEQGVMYNIEAGGVKQLAIEVTLAQQQWRFWERALRSCGFKRTIEFVNSNSGNRVRIYYLLVGQPEKGE